MSPSFQVAILGLSSPVRPHFCAVLISLDSLVKVFAAANAPINWNLIEDFNFEDKNCKALLRNNKNIFVGNLVKDSKTSYAYKTPIFKYLDLYISRKLWA